jgi:hypothetical protein
VEDYRCETEYVERREVKLLSLRRLGLLKQWRQVAATVENALYANAIGDDAEEDDVATDDFKARAFANLGAELIKEGLLCDLQDRAPNLPNDFDCAQWVVVRHELCGCFQIAFNMPGEL